MRTEEIRLSFHGLRVRFRVFSPDEEPIVHRALFVSSPAGDVENWEALAGMLTECGCLCVTAELPGFGKSPCGAFVPQDNDTRARILWGILDEVEVRRNEEMTRWHLIGHGSAAAAVMTMAQQHPDSALSRVLVCPVLDRFLPPPLFRLLQSRFSDKLISAWFRYWIENRKRFGRLAVRLYGARPRRARVSALHRAWTREGMRETVVRLLREGYSFPKEAYGVQTPLMLLWSTDDRLLGGEIPVRLLKSLPSVEKHMLHSGHMAMETDPDVLRDFLRGWFRFAEGREKGVVRPTTHTHADRQA